MSGLFLLDTKVRDFSENRTISTPNKNAKAGHPFKRDYPTLCLLPIGTKPTARSQRRRAYPYAHRAALPQPHAPDAWHKPPHPPFCRQLR